MSNILVNLINLLEVGTATSRTACNLCCPECGPAYAIGTVEAMLKFFESLNSIDSTLPCSCCYSIQASIETSLKFQEGIATYECSEESPFGPCDDCDFQSCFNEITQLLSPQGLTQLLDKGIVEYGHDGASNLCILKDYALSVVNIEGGETTFEEVFLGLINTSIASYCCEDTVVIGTMESVLLAAEACVQAPPPVPQ